MSLQNPQIDPAALPNITRELRAVLGEVSWEEALHALCDANNQSEDALEAARQAQRTLKISGQRFGTLRDSVILAMLSGGPATIKEMLARTRGALRDMDLWSGLVGLSRHSEVRELDGERWALIPHRGSQTSQSAEPDAGEYRRRTVVQPAALAGDCGEEKTIESPR
jgi:hypothetical protein